MSWTAPMTAVAGATFTAAEFNTYVRDNFNECPTAKATSDGQFFVSTGANVVAARQMAFTAITTSQTTTSLSYTDLTSVGPTVTVNTGSRALVLFSSSLDNSGTNGASQVSVAVSGATTIAASDNWQIKRDGVTATNSHRYGTAHMFDTLTSGSNTFTMKYKVGSATGTFAARELIVLPF